MQSGLKYLSWLDIVISLYCCPADNYGTQRTFRQVILSDFAIPHKWFFKDNETKEWISGYSSDLETMIDLRTGKVSKEEKPLLKQTIQCYTPSGLYQCKKKGKEVLINCIPILQLDFDNLDQYDIEEVKQAIFNLPFVAYVGKSVSGNGLFALVLIEEPDKLKEYAEHCFVIFKYYGLPVDTSKGRNYSDLRFVSYDGDMLIREFPTPLKIKQFYTPKEQPKKYTRKASVSGNGLISWAVREIQNAQIGNRFDTVRKVAYTLGGHGIGLNEIKTAITTSSQYTGLESKYLLHADEGYEAGQLKPILHD